MGALVLTGNTSGSVTVAVPAVAGTNTATFPAATGTVMVSGNQPAFCYYGSASLSLSTATNTLMATDTKEYDTANAFNTSTYQFNPQVAGYYFVQACLGMGGSTGFNYIIQFYKNGSSYKIGSQQANNPSGGTVVQGACLVYLNGSTDYVQAYATQGSGATQGTGTGLLQYRFEGFLIRNA